MGYLGSGLASGVGLAKDVIKDIPNAYDTLANDAGAVWRKWTTPSDTSQKVTLPTAQSYSNATPPATLSLPNTDSTPSGHYEVRGRVSVWVPDSQKTGTFSHEGSGLSQPSISAPLDTHKAGNFPSTPDAPSAGLASGAPPAAAPAASSPPAAGGGDERRADQPTLGLVPSTQPNINDGQPPVDGNQKDGGGFWHDIGQGLRGAGDWLGRNQNWLVPVGEGLATAASTPTHNFWYAIAQGAGAGLNATQDIQNQMTQRDLVRADTNVSTQHGIGVGIKNYADLVNQWQQAQARGLNPPPLPEFATQHGYTGPMPTGPGLLARTKSAAPGPTEPGWKPAVGGGGTPDASELFNSGIVPTEGGTDPTTGAFRTSPKGAIGPSQAVPSTAADVAKELNIPFDEHRLKTDSEYNRQIGQRYYADQLKKYSDPLVAAAAYNAGPGRVDDAIKAAQADGTSYLSKLPAETQNYVSAFEARTSGIRQSRPTTAGATQQATISPTSTFGDDFDALRNDPTMASDPYRLQQFYSKWAPLATGESGDIITGAVKTAAGLLGENRTGTSVGANGLQPTAGAISTAILEGGAPGVSDRRNDFMKNYQTVNSNLQAQESQLNTLDEIYKNYNGNMLDRSKAQIEGVLTGFGIPVANYPALKAFIEGPNINPDATVKSQYDDAMKTVNMQVLQGLDNLPGGAPKSELEHLEAVAARPELDPIARHDLSARLHTLVQRQIDMNNSIAGEMKRSGTADPFNSDFANRPENSVDAYYKRNKLSITPYAGTPPAAASGQASPTNGSTERLPATVDNIGHSFQINGKTITVIGDGKGGATYGILHQ